MSAQEKIAAAIEELEDAKDGAFPGPWSLKPDGALAYRLLDVDGDTVAGNGRFGLVTGPLIVTLHRTIDAQLALLRQALKVLEPIGDGYRIPDDAVDLELALALAILGEA